MVPDPFQEPLEPILLAPVAYVQAGGARVSCYLEPTSLAASRETGHQTGCSLLDPLASNQVGKGFKSATFFIVISFYELTSKELSSDLQPESFSSEPFWSCFFKAVVHF
jgi:hypothetical protein